MGNHEITLDIDKNSPTQIELRLFDWERFGKDEPMGMVSISNDEAISLSKKPSSWFDLSDCKSGKILISTEYIGETFKSVRRSEGAKGLRNLLKSENSGVSQNDTCTNDESGQPKTQKIVTNVTRKTTTTKRVLRRVVIDANGKEHVTEEILEDPVDLGEPPQNTKLENKTSMVVEDTSQKVTKTK